jgi:hypothetical protein
MRIAAAELSFASGPVDSFKLYRHLAAKGIAYIPAVLTHTSPLISHIEYDRSNVIPIETLLEHKLFGASPIDLLHQNFNLFLKTYWTQDAVYLLE